MNFSDPIALFHSALDALNAESWLVAAEHCDLVSLRIFQQQLLHQFAPPRPEYTLTPEVLMRHQPDMPRAVAEFQVAEHRRQADPSRRLAHDLPGISSVEELSASEPLVVFASWLQGRSPRMQVRRLIERGHVPAAAAGPPSSLSVPPYYWFLVLGTVPDGDGAAHVVYRDKADETTPWTGDIAAHLATLPLDEQRLTRLLSARGHARVAFCRRQPDLSWRLIADRDFLSVNSRRIGDISR